MFGVCDRYLTGETDCKTWREYVETVERETREGEEACWREREQQETRLIAMFSLCGYEYRYDTGARDFAEITGLNMGRCGEHELIEQARPNALHCLDENELHELTGELRKHITYFIYDKEAAQHGDNGRKDTV